MSIRNLTQRPQAAAFAHVPPRPRSASLRGHPRLQGPGRRRDRLGPRGRLKRHPRGRAQNGQDQRGIQDSRMHSSALKPSGKPLARSRCRSGATQNIDVPLVDQGLLSALAADRVSHEQTVERIRRLHKFGLVVAERLARGEQVYPNLSRGAYAAPWKPPSSKAATWRASACSNKAFGLAARTPARVVPPH